MEFLGTLTQYAEIGYPLIFFYVIGLIGLFLVVYRPYWAFLFSLFCLAARNFHAAVLTRAPIAGPYLNLNDLLLWIALFAMVFILMRIRKMIWMPKILFVIFVLIFVGDVQSLFKYGTQEHVVRRIWSTAVFPISFLVSTNMVKSEEYAKRFYWALFFGAVVAAIQHIYFIWSASYQQMSEEAQIRTISYITSGGLYLVMASMFMKIGRGLTRLQSIFYFVGIALIAISYLLALTRGVYVAAIASLLLLPILLKGEYRIYKTFHNALLTTVMAILIVGVIFPNLDVKTILNKRFESFIYKDALSQAYETRYAGQQTEIELWVKSSVILGIGSSLPPEYEYATTEATGALYHVGYSAYLAHYGLIGLFVYGFLLPVSTILAARNLYFKYTMDYGRKIALIAIASSLFDIFALSWSHHHLGVTTHLSGLIYGCLWGLYQGKKVEETAVALNKYRQSPLALSSALGKYEKQ